MFSFPLLELLHEKKAKMGEKQENLQQNTVCLKQQVYTTPENFIQTLFVIFVTFRGSGCDF